MFANCPDDDDDEYEDCPPCPTPTKPVGKWRALIIETVVTCLVTAALDELLEWWQNRKTEKSEQSQ